MGAFYKSFMDEARIEKAGASGLKDKLAEIQATKTREALAALMGRQNADFHGGIFGVGIDVDIKDPKHYAVYLGQAGLGLPDRDYYLKPDFAAKKEKYQAYAAQLLGLLEWPEFPKIAELFDKASLETLQAWQAFNIADHAAPYLSKAFVDALFEMRNKTLSGQAEQKVRWKRGVQAVSGGDYGAGDRYDRFGNLGWAVGQLYSAKYFPPAAKAKIEELVTNLKVAMHERIKGLDWMGEATKVQALKKLDTYNIKVGYPDKPRDYSNVEIRDDDLVGNVRRAAVADWAFNLQRLPGPVDMADWGMTPQTNDAYNGALRDIVFPAGILQPPMFDANADPAVNYGAIGAVIGHELTHGFDDQGRKFDAEGKLNDWWTAEDAKTFEARAKVLGEQYSKFEPLPGAKVNGELTMGENIADLGGVVIALDAYRASLKGKAAPVIDGLTGEQRVFLGWAQAWRGKLRDDAVRRQVVSDPHSPRQYRVNGVMRNIDAWYDAFKVKPEEKLFVDPNVATPFFHCHFERSEAEIKNLEMSRASARKGKV